MSINHLVYIEVSLLTNNAKQCMK